MRAHIAGTGRCVPERKLTNSDLEELVETSDEWIVARTGIRERSIAAAEDATSDLATRAAQQALDMAGMEADELDLILLGTVTPDMLTPSTASLVQRNLKLGRPIPSMDLSAACSGFVYGLQLAQDAIAVGRYRNILLIGAECLSRIVDYEDRATCIIFADAAGAAVISADDKPGSGIIATQLHSDGNYWDLIHMPGGGSRRPASPYMLTQREQYLRMNGRQVFKLAVQAMEQVMLETAGEAGWDVSDVDHFLVHQANVRIIEALRDRLSIPPEKVPMNIERTGNTSAARTRVLRDESNRQGRFKPGDKLLRGAFGAGLTWGSAAVEWTLS